METSLFTVDVAPEALDQYRQLHETMPQAVRDELEAEGIVEMHIFVADDQVMVCARSTRDMSACLSGLGTQPAYQAWAREFADVFASTGPTFARPIWQF